MKVIGYVRVSTEEQSVSGVSLAAQESKVRAYCDLFGHTLVNVVIDAGQSAKTLNRPGLTEALSSLKNGYAEGILVTKLDRLTRSVKDLGALLDDYLQKFALLSVQEQCDTSSASGRMVLNMLMSVAQWERETISERTSTALQFKKSQGVKLGPPAMENEAIISRMRGLKEQGLTLTQIAEQLTEEGHQTQRGGKWYAGTVQKVLKRVGQA